jgi:death-on-curing protein
MQGRCKSSPSERSHLGLEHVHVIHEEQLAAHGGLPGMRDPGLLESAVAQASATLGGSFVHEDLFAMAAAYALASDGEDYFPQGKCERGRSAQGGLLLEQGPAT